MLSAHCRLGGPNSSSSGWPCARSARCLFSSPVPVYLPLVHPVPVVSSGSSMLPWGPAMAGSPVGSFGASKLYLRRASAPCLGLAPSAPSDCQNAFACSPVVPRISLPLTCPAVCLVAPPAPVCSPSPLRSWCRFSPWCPGWLWIIIPLPVPVPGTPQPSRVTPEVLSPQGNSSTPGVSVPLGYSNPPPTPWRPPPGFSANP